MSRATTRQAHIRPYKECRNCPDKISGYGKCQKGHDNFYYRKGKDNKCEKCMKTERDLWESEKFNLYNRR